MKYIFATIFFCVFHVNISAQETSDTSSYFDIIARDFSYAAHDGKAVFKKAITPTWEKAITLSGLMAGTILLIQWDEDFRLSAQKGVTETGADISKAVKFYGERNLMVGLSGGVYLTGLFFKNEDIRTTGRLTLEALALAGITGGGLKVALGRSRPKNGDGPRKFTFWETDNAYQSMPSGHTTVAFTVSTVLAEQIDTWWARAIFYPLAAATSYSRVYDDEHWTSDIFLGAAIGYLSGKTIVEINRERETAAIINSLIDRTTLYPVPGGVGILVKF
jgi:membrane-associated phospholipid phosphatase